MLSLSAVVNPVLIKLYYVKMEELKGKRGSCRIIRWKFGERGSHRLQIPNDKGSNPDSRNMNEYFLFHGCEESIIEEIWQTGFDPRRAGEVTGKMFGAATYFTPNASKADAYTEPRSNRLKKEAIRHIVIARVLLGESYLTTASMTNALRPPDGHDGRPLDSVWVDCREHGGAVDHPEVMLYDKGQAYPEIIVEYKHSCLCKCAECFKRPA